MERKAQRVKYLNAQVNSKKAEKLKNFLESKVVGQKRAIKKIVDNYELHLSGYLNERPIITALFAGLFGVGKTYITKLLAEYFLHSPNLMVKVSCANFQRGHETSSLLGAPPGYIGYDKEPILSQARLDNPAVSLKIDEIRKKDEHIKEYSRVLEEGYKKLLECGSNEKARIKALKKIIQKTKNKISKRIVSIISAEMDAGKFRPVSVVLFDEIEKASIDLHNTLLDITSKGTVNLHNGNTTFFNHSFVFMTSNVGSRAIARELKGGG